MPLSAYKQSECKNTAMNDKQTKHKMCTMNCGGTISDPRTKEERQAACGDCIEVDTPDLAQPPDSAGSIESQLDRITLLKMHSLIDQGMKPVGVVMMNANGKRATIDMGRVTWTDGISDVSDIDVGDMPENGAGIGLARKSNTLGMPEKLRALSNHMENVAVEMDFFGGFAPWAQRGGELMGAAMMVAEWAACCAASKEPQ